jgi:hypothetical protein
VLADILMECVDVSLARSSHVIHSRSLLNNNDLSVIESIRDEIMNKQGILENNPQNITHINKVGTFLNSPPLYPMYSNAPQVIGKLLNFANEAWLKGNWSGTEDKPGPLYGIKGGVSSLSIRVVEHWKYKVGGGLVDNFHYDVDSAITIVSLLSNSNDYEGGLFRTYESDDTHLIHSMNQGDVICFISHKFHNITPLIRGVRKSLVLELWQGGNGHTGR